jgi:hypothetical protein
MSNFNINLQKVENINKIEDNKKKTTNGMNNMKKVEGNQ